MLPAQVPGEWDDVNNEWTGPAYKFQVRLQCVPQILRLPQLMLVMCEQDCCNEASFKKTFRTLCCLG